MSPRLVRPLPRPPATVPPERSWPAALAEIGAGAAARDRDPGGAFPEDAFAALERAGALAPGALDLAAELRLLREVAFADLGVARILDGHRNAIERLRVQAPADLRDRELAAMAAGTVRAGVWGADPAPGEGEPAAVRGGALHGTKTFCSGAGGLQRSLVLAGDLPVYVDLTVPGTVAIDRRWFAGAAMRSSASHRVTFTAAPVLAVLEGPGGLLRQPWFARDAVRTAATWAGAADRVVEDALDHLAAGGPPSAFAALAAGRLRTWQATIGLWLDAAPAQLDADPAGTAARLRTALSDAARAILDEAERATGSRPIATGAPGERGARDLRLLLLQHRLEPILARTGRAELEGRG